MERHRECPMCLKCKHMKIQYAPFIKQRIIGCNMRDCKYERKDDESRDRNRPKSK